jgi:hypothetical protein
LEQPFRGRVERGSFLQTLQPIGRGTSAPFIRGRRQSFALTPAQYVGGEVEEGAVLIAHFGSCFGTEELR